MTDVVVQQNVPIPLRDGVRTFADVYRPALAGQHPVLLQRLPYNKMAPHAINPVRAAQEGYAVVVQDCRGRYTSEGEFVPFVVDIDDGYDSVEWCAAQEWSNGRVGMYGMSYVGATQWLAAISAPPHLRAICPAMTASDYHDGWVYQGGALFLSFLAPWVAQHLGMSHLPRLGLSGDALRAEERRIMLANEHPRSTLAHTPLSELPLLKWEGLADYFFDWLRHPDADGYWTRQSITPNHQRVTVPAYSIGGWYDLFVTGPLRNFAGVRANGATKEAREGQKLIVGPWAHTQPNAVLVGKRYFGYDAMVTIEDLQLRWFAYWLKEIDNGIMREPPARLYVQNEGWRDEHEWPLARTVYTPFFLHSGGRANSLEGDGTLGRSEPASEPPDLYLYNPLNPVPTVGAAIHDQRYVERRQDVLVYTTAPLAAPLEVTGPVTMMLHASSSAPDTDFTAKLVDVSPDGLARNVCDGILRARYRNSLARAELLEPGRPYELRVDMTVTSYLFPAGHSVRIEIASANFPKFDRNPNTGRAVADERETCPALQTVYHDAGHPSHLLLPVIPR